MGNERASGSSVSVIKLSSKRVVLTALTSDSIGAVSTEADTIPPGTKINLSNWQRYQQFMTEGTKLIFAGDHFWSVPKNAEITVGPTIPIGGRPKLYIDYTEKYGSQAKLVRSDTGDYVPGNYIAGAPGPYERGSRTHRREGPLGRLLSPPGEDGVRAG